MNRQKGLKLAAKVLISLFFVWWIIYQVDWIETREYLKRINFFWVVVYIILYLLGIAVSSYKWKLLALHKGIKLPLKEFYKAYFSATFVNNFMPSFIGGDSFKIYRIGKLADNFKGATSSVVMDRFTGLLGGMILVVLFALLNFKFFFENKILLSLALFSFGGLFFLFLILEFFKKREIQTSLKFVDKVFNKVICEINHYNGGEKVILKVILLSFLFNLIGLAGANFVLFLALGVRIEILDYLSVIFLASVVSSLPISINNIGVKEWAYITFFGFFGLSAGAVVSVAITSRIIQMLLSFLAWPIYLKERKK